MSFQSLFLYQLSQIGLLDVFANSGKNRGGFARMDAIHYYKSYTMAYLSITFHIQCHLLN